MHDSRQPSKLFAILLIPLLALAGWSSASTPKTPAYDFSLVRIPMLSITMKESQHHVEMLASREFQGRKTGTPGQWLAAKYIANEFADYELRPAGDNGTFYQNFDIAHVDLQHASIALVAASGRRIAFKLRKDFMPQGFTSEGELDAGIAFVGYGITAPEYGYDDYANIDVRGKVVLALRHEPNEHEPESVFGGKRPSHYSEARYKALNALKHGAAGILLVTEPRGGHGSDAPRGYWPSLHSGSTLPKKWKPQSEVADAGLPVSWVSGRVAETILDSKGENLAALQRRLDEDLRPVSFIISGLTIHLKTELEREVRQTQNVVAWLEGSDPELSHEIVIIGAHYDHLGDKRGKIYFGADDNASGTAGLIEIAEAFTKTPILPRRSIVFIAFSGEELGLLGSKYYVEHTVAPLARTASMINLDMISRNEDNNLTVVGTNRSPELHDVNLAANEEIGFNLLYNGERYFKRSDQACFAEHGVPVIFYNTDTHNDYHRPTDTAEKINPEKLARVARLAFLVAWKVAELDERPSYRPL